ncbi:type III secretion system protein SctP [Xanthomonas hortorum pv. vitians]|uniref:Type III secretion system protein SctP n=2 Tax=Xanthomonas hortorum TaxID=56454 RepID=A0A6V7BCJ4_9XANT|nr:type III secretion system protein SctP [Xanthomonas hortorum]APP86321.1 type III secretion protein [Xanthomonas hortorum pv. gardneri]ASW47669.1 type III secretion protein [Xanthomonas hortorum]MCE4279601.1 type III secretion system protein SctP [Xanthomonas hortorum pv. vitians]MCE4285092.1 type III secretion system protein SctP [Xanthomonas hortorum pv. vitians]MCE4289522.1 type III secretion system protein SctP [Xanthomonas hortorum pv. vitians]
MRKPPVRHVRILPIAGAPLQAHAAPAPARATQRVSFLQLRRRLSSVLAGLPDTVLPEDGDDDPTLPDVVDAASDDHGPAALPSATPCLDDGNRRQIARGDDGDALGRQIATEWIRTQRAQLAINHIALRVAEFCNATPVRGAGIWEAWLEINHDILPQTTLFLRLSPDQLSLRFDSGSPETREVLLNGRKRLDTALKAALSDTLQISIEVV